MLRRFLSAAALGFFRLDAEAADVLPTSGPAAGGNPVLITNSAPNWGDGGDITNVVFGDIGTTQILEQGTNWAWVLAPPHPEGLVNIVVQSASLGDTLISGAYTYNPPGSIGWNFPAGWTNLGAGVSNTVFALTVGLQGELYVGGSFTNAGEIPAQRVARWDGASWTNLGSGLNGTVNALAVDTNGHVYAGGSFTNAGETIAYRIAKWDGTSWTNLGSGLSNTVNALAIGPAGELYAGGMFTNAGDCIANYVAQWTGASWTNLGSGLNNRVNALAVGPQGELFAGGSFSDAGNPTTRFFALWNGTAWNYFENAFPMPLFALATTSNYGVYAGGQLVGATNFVHYFQNFFWDKLGTGFSLGPSFIYALTLGADKSLYAGGSFTNNNGLATRYIAHWNGTTWTNLGSGMNAQVRALAKGREGEIVAGGFFTNAGGIAANYVAQWNPPRSPLFGVAPTNGPHWGGTTVTILGTHLGDGADITNVTLCGIPVQSIVSQSATQVVVVSGATLSPGLGDVRLFSASFGETVKTNAYQYTYPDIQIEGTNGFNIESDEEVSLSKGSLYPETLAGTQRIHSFRLTNPGTRALSISGFNIEGPDSTAFTVQEVPATVSPGGISNITVMFHPTVTGAYSASLILTNDSEINPFILNLEGTAFATSTNVGPAAGGNQVTVFALGLGDGSDITQVLVDGIPATIVDQGADWVTLIMPSHPAGSVDLTLQSTSQGTRTLADAYLYNPPGELGIKFPGAWYNLDSGLDNSVRTLAFDPASGLFAGGIFTNAGGKAANYIAQWNGSTWTNLGAGLNNSVAALAIGADGAIFAGGYFTQAGGKTANYIAQWNGSTWTNLGTGMNSPVMALTVDPVGTLYAGGHFTNAGGKAANYIAQWNGSTWTNLGAGLNSPVMTLAVDPDGTLYAGGYFTNAGGKVANYIAQWNGSTWTNLGAGVSHPVFALLTAASHSLYAGGVFTNAGGLTANRIAHWNGLNWNPVGSGFDGPAVVDLAWGPHGTVYAGGVFSNAGSVSTRGIAFWDGLAWTNLSSGVNSGVYVLAQGPADQLFAGGDFSLAGESPANAIALWDPPRDPVFGVAPTNGHILGGTTVTLLGNHLGEGADITNVTLCGIPVQSIVSQSATQVVVVSSPGPQGVGDVRVYSTSFGETVKSNAYRYGEPGLQILGTNQEVIVHDEPPSESKGSRYPAVRSGDAWVHTFCLTNPGNLEVAISGVITGGPDPDTVTLLDCPDAIPAGDAALIRVQFQPSTSGDFAASLVFANTSPTNPYTLRLAGTGYSGSDDNGPAAGGNSITFTAGLLGNGDDITHVWVGGEAAIILTQDTHSVTVRLPAHPAGLVDVVIQSASQGDHRLLNAYAYNPAGSIGWSFPGVWTNLGSGMNSNVHALAVGPNGELYAGGLFTTAGGRAANRIAMWNGGVWTNLGSGLNSNVYSLAVSPNGDLYAAGSFTAAGGQAANRVAQWNGSSWTNLGSGFSPNDWVQTLSVGANGQLFAGGGFTNAGGTLASNVALWNGTNWSPLGRGIVGPVKSLSLSPHEILYAGGEFIQAGEVAANRVARWDGQSWTNLGGGMDDPGCRVNSWAIRGDAEIFAGGRFTQADGIFVNNLAYWNGTAWSPVGTGLNGYVVSLALGRQGELYAGGYFTNAEGRVSDCIAQWDGVAWTNLGGGILSDVFALATGPDGSLYAGGAFTNAGGKTASRIAKWFRPPPLFGVSPTNGSLLGGTVVTIIGANLGNGSDITNVTLCGRPVQSIIGQSSNLVQVVSAPGPAGLGDVRVFSTHYGETVKADAFTYSGPILQVLSTNGLFIAHNEPPDGVKGTRFIPVAAGCAVTNYLCITNPGAMNLVISGVATGNSSGAAFTSGPWPATIPAGRATNIAVRFLPPQAGNFAATFSIANNSTSTPFVIRLVGMGFTASPPTGPASGGNRVTFTGGLLGDGSDITNILVDGISAPILGQETNRVDALLPPHAPGRVDVIIQSTSTGPIPLAGAYTYNPGGWIGWILPTAWTNLGSGLNNWVKTLAIGRNGEIYAGGYFTNAGGIAANYVAQWNGSSWTNLGGGLNGSVYALCVDSNGDLFAGGEFTVAGSTQANNIARWDGQQWFSLGDGMSGPVYALASHQNGRIIAGGSFTIAGHLLVNYIANWDGNVWSEFGTGVNGPVYSVETSPNNDVYVGGVFSAAGAISARGIARWTGTAWTNLGTGISPTPVYALAMGSAGELYAGGNFTNAGGVLANRIAKWDGVSWSALGSGMNQSVYALAASSNDQFYAGGIFNTAGGKSANQIAYWNGTKWTNLAMGVAGTVSALALSTDTRLSVGGNFGMADNQIVNFIAQWGHQVQSGVSPTNGPIAGGTVVTLLGTNLCNGSDVTNVTLCGIPVQSIVSQSATQVVVVAGPAPAPITGDVRIFSTSFGETVKSNAFTYQGPIPLILGTNRAVVSSGAPASLDAGTMFDATRVGLARTNIYCLTNAGVGTLHLNGIATGGVGAAAFTVAGLPAALAEGESADFSVVFQPTEPGDFSACIAIANDSLISPYTINLAGNGFHASILSGPSAGSNSVTLWAGALGSGDDITNVNVGGVTAVIQAQGSNWVTLLMPDHAPGAVDIVVQSASRGNTRLDSAYTYNPPGWIETESIPDVRFAWESIIELPEIRRWPAAGVLGSNLYAIGGADINGTAQTNVYRFNGTSWTEVAGLPEPREALGVGVLNGYLYAVGGRDGSAIKTNVFCFDGTNWTEVAGLPQPRCELAVGVLQDRLYAVGGRDAAMNQSSVFVFNGTNWSEGTGLPEPRAGLAVGAVSNRLHAIGGYRNAWPPSTDTFVFDGTNWTVSTPLPQPRYGLAAAELDNRLHAIGGYDGTAQTNVYRLDGDQWTDIAGLSTGREYFAAAVLNGQIYAIGGDSFVGPHFIDNCRYPTLLARTRLSPGVGSALGGTTVTIPGANLGNGSDITNVLICGIPVASIFSQSATQVVVITAPSSTSVTGAVQVFSTSYGETRAENAYVYTWPGMKILGTNLQAIGTSDGPDYARGTDFGGWSPGESITHILTLTNESPLDLNLSAITTNWGDFESFQLDASPGIIPGYGSTTLQLTYHAPASGLSTPLILFNLWNDSTNNPYTLTAQGSVFTLSTNRGPAEGGNELLISGHYLGSGWDISQVFVDGISASILYQNSDSVSIIMPAGISSLGTIIVCSASRGCQTLHYPGYTYNPKGWIGARALTPQWTSLAAGLDNRVLALAIATNGVLFAGGEFLTSGGYPAVNRIAAWTGEQWTNLLSGLNGAVRCLAVGRQGELYAGGDFTWAGDGPANRIARWNGIAWTNLGTGTDGSVRTLAIGPQGELYAGGSFIEIGDQYAPNIARWDGLNWTNLGAGTLGPVNALAVDTNGNLYAGGDFGQAGEMAAARVAKWMGSHWTNLDTGVNAPVHALAVGSGGEVYAGGEFTWAGAVQVNHIAQWNGTGWTNLGAGTEHWVRALAAGAQGELYAGGDFAANHVAQWTGTFWTNLGSGVDNWVTALAVGRDGELYVGGDFQQAGGASASRVAQWGLVRYGGVTPSNGLLAGGFTITLSGDHLGDGADITNVTVCDLPVAEIISQCATQVVVIAAPAPSPSLGPVRVYSISHGLTEKTNAFAYRAQPRITVRSSGPSDPANGDYDLEMGHSYLYRTLGPDTRDTTQLVCTGWTLTGNLSDGGDETQCVFTITNDAVLTWHWATNYLLTLDAAPNGGVVSNTLWVRADTWITNAVYPSNGYHFTHWTGDLTTNQNQMSIWMDRPYSLTAHFEINVYAVTASGSAGGVIIPSGTVFVVHGRSTNFLIGASEFHHIARIETNSGAVNYPYDNTFAYVIVTWSNIVSDGAIHATFAANLWSNGVPESWLIAHYPGSNQWNDLALSDSDRDGVPTWMEYQSGTDPTNRKSFLGLEQIRPSPEGIVIRWQGITGKYYRVERGSNLVDQPPFKVPVQTHIPGVEPLNTVTDQTAVGPGPWFYRIQVE